MVGDLDVNKPESVEAVPDKPSATLNVPTNVDEKVGAKIDATKIVPATKPNNQSGPSVAPAEPAKAPSGDNFWNSVYSQQSPGRTTIEESSPPEPFPGAVATPSANDIKKTQPQPVPVATYPIAPKPQTVNVPAPNQTAGVPNPAPAPVAGQMPLRKDVPTTAAPKYNPTSGLSNPKNKLKMIIIGSVLGIMLLFSGGVFLTEQGIISLGLEKVYGAVRLEALWGGLPANAENAFAMSAVKMKSEKSFKAESKATITVNKGVKSNLIAPIVSASALPVIALGDEQLGSAMTAIMSAVTDAEVDTLPTDELLEDTTDTGQSTTQTTDQSTQSTTSEVQSTTPDPQSSASVPVSTVEQISTEISAGFSEDVSGATINLKSKKSQSSKIELVYSNNKIYTKTSSDIVYSQAAKGGWLAYDLKGLGGSSPSEKLFSSDFSGSNFSIVGNRVGSENINGSRCFHYKGKVTIGTALEAFGLKENSVESMDIEFWSGIKDRRIRKIVAEIIPNNSSAVTRIDIEANFSDYGSDAGNYIVPATSTPSVLGENGQIGATTTEPAGGTATLTPEKQRDSTRKTDLADIAKGLESYYAANNKYPIVTKSERILPTSGTLYSALVPQYISSIPIDPNDPKYYYGYESSGASYKLSAVLEDKTDTEGKSVGSVYLYFLNSQ